MCTLHAFSFLLEKSVKNQHLNYFSVAPFKTSAIFRRLLYIDGPELICRISRRLFNSIATRILHDKMLYLAL